MDDADAPAASDKEKATHFHGFGTQFKQRAVKEEAINMTLWRKKKNTDLELEPCSSYRLSTARRKIKACHHLVRGYLLSIS